MTIEIGFGKPKRTEFSLDGTILYVRKMPFGLGFRLQSVAEGDDIPVELLAEIVATCVVNKDGKPLLTIDRVLELDLEPMMQLFNEVSGASIKAEDAEKN